MAFTCPYRKFLWTGEAFGVQSALSVSLHLMFKLFFKYLDDFLVFWIDNLLIYSQNEEEHRRNINLVFEKIQEVGIKLKMSKCEFLKVKLNI